MRLVKYRGKWAVYVEGKRHSLRTEDRAEAERNLEVFRKQYYAPKETVGEIVKAYLSARADKPSIRGMEDAWKAASYRFANLRPDQVGRDVCLVYAKDRGNAGVTSGTVRKELGVIRQALRWHNPQAQIEIELPPSPPPKDRYLTREEYEALRDACTHPHLKLFVQIAAGTGARKGAILDLTWQQVDFDRGQIRLSKGGETNKRRAVVTIDETLVDALRVAKKDSLSPYVINYGGERVKSINKGFREACNRAGLKGVSPHTIRHSVAVWLAEAGRPFEEIAQVLGHTTATITYRVYARYSPTYLKKAASILRV
jgi:integrase